MTMLDPITGWFEIVEEPSFFIEDMENKEFRETFDKTSVKSADCLARLGYPDIHTNRSEFKKDVCLY